jgi:hypothetical protein
MANASAKATTKKLLKNVSGFSAKALTAALPTAEIASPADNDDSATTAAAAIAMTSLSKGPVVVVVVLIAWSVEIVNAAATPIMGRIISGRNKSKIASLFFKSV